MEKQSNLINNEIKESAFIQKIYSTSYYICLTVRLPGITRYIYIGRGGGYEGLWIGNKKPNSFLRKRDKFLEFLRKHLSSCSLDHFEIDLKDRILTLHYQKWGRISKFFFFYNARNLYFVNFYYDKKKERMLLFKSWDSTVSEVQNIDYDIFDEVGRRKLDRETHDKIIIPVEGLLRQEETLALKKSRGGKSKKFLKRKKGKILADLKRIQAISMLEKLVSEEKDFSLLPSKNILFGIKLNFKTKDHYKRRDEVYLKIKKLKKAKKILELRLKDTELNLEDTENKESEGINHLKVINPVWGQKSNKPKKNLSVTKNYHLYDFKNFSLGVGNTAVGNDQLRNEWAKKNDYWFHLEGDKSPHIIIKLKQGVLDQEKINIAGAALIAFSSLNYQEANIIYTQVKNLKGVKGAAGKVIYNKEKHIRLFLEKPWDVYINELHVGGEP